MKLQRSNGSTVMVLVVAKVAMAAHPAEDTAAVVAEAVTVRRADHDDDDVVPLAVAVAEAAAVLVSPCSCSGQAAALAVASSPASPVQRLATAHLRRRGRSGWRGA